MTKEEFKKELIRRSNGYNECKVKDLEKYTKEFKSFIDESMANFVYALYGSISYGCDLSDGDGLIEFLFGKIDEFERKKKLRYMSNDELFKMIKDEVEEEFNYWTIDYRITMVKRGVASFDTIYRTYDKTEYNSLFLGSVDDVVNYAIQNYNAEMRQHYKSDLEKWIKYETEHGLNFIKEER